MRLMSFRRSKWHLSWYERPSIVVPLTRSNPVFTIEKLNIFCFFLLQIFEYSLIYGIFAP